MKIGFFDSGLGGLTIMKAVRALIGQYDYIYYGDTANLPYGGKTEEELYTLTHDGVEKLFKEGAAIVIVACNTSSAETLRKLQDNVFNSKYPERRVLGVIIPTAEEVLEKGSQKVLLIATKRTVDSKKYDRELEKISSKIILHSVATPTLVPLIEEHEFEGAFTELKKIIDPRAGEIDTIILGCTHYTLIKEYVRKEYPEITVISQDEVIPKKLEDYLHRHSEIESTLSRKGTLKILLSKEGGKYEQMDNLTVAQISAGNI